MQNFNSVRSSIIRLVLITSLPVIFIAWGIIVPYKLEISSFYGASALLLISLSFVYTILLGKQIYLALISDQKPINNFKMIHEICASLTEQREMKLLMMNFIRQTVVLIEAEDGMYLTEGEIRLPAPHATELPILLNDISSDSRYENNESIKSYLSVPIVSPLGDVHGNLIYVHSKANCFSQNHLELISALAIQISILIENNRLATEASQAIELRDTFLSVASHELKTPLTSIYLQFESLKRKVIQSVGTDEKVIDLFSRFQFQLGRLTRLVNELLDVTQIASGKMSVHLEEVDLEKLIGYVCANFEIESIQKGSPITFEVKNSVTGNWDSNRLEQVITNLVSNAIKYGNSRPIEVTLSREGNTALIEICDHGLGIALEDQSRIFKRFERAIDNNPDIRGIGLGLFICKEIILHQGGDIQVESQVGEGSTFTMRLPIS